MATKSPAKGKKPAPSKEKTAKKPAKAAARPAAAVEEEDRPDDDEDDDDDEMEAAPKPAVKKPAAAAGKSATGPGGEPPAVVPARRLTPEAKAKVNEMVKKGMPLGDALKIAASWETFVAPVKDEPAKLVQGKSFDGGRPRRPRENTDDEEPSGAADLDDEEPAGAVDAGEE